MKHTSLFFTVLTCINFATLLHASERHIPGKASAQKTEIHSLVVITVAAALIAVAAANPS